MKNSVSTYLTAEDAQMLLNTNLSSLAMCDIHENAQGGDPSLLGMLEHACEILSPSRIEEIGNRHINGNSKAEEISDARQSMADVIRPLMDAADRASLSNPPTKKAFRLACQKMYQVLNINDAVGAFYREAIDTALVKLQMASFRDDSSKPPPEERGRRDI